MKALVGRENKKISFEDYQNTMTSNKVNINNKKRNIDHTLRIKTERKNSLSSNLDIEQKNKEPALKK